VKRFKCTGFLYLLLTALLGGCGGTDNTPTFSFSGTRVTVSQGSFNTANIATNFTPGATDVVTLSLEAPNPGITGTFSPPTVSAAIPNTVLSVNVAASVSPGSYQLTVRGTSGGRVNTVEIELVVDTSNPGGGEDTLTLLAAGGPINLGGSNPSGTLVVYRFLLNGEPVEDDFTAALAGPEGWNDDEVVTFEVGGGNLNNFIILPGVAVVSGVYELAADVGGDALSVSFTIDAAPELPQTEGINVGATETTVEIEWAAVPDALSYLVSINRAEDGSAVASGLTVDTTASVELAALEPDTYRVLLYSFTADLTTNAPLPAQINASLSASEAFEVEGGGTPGGDFSISLRFNGAVSASQREAFEDAAAQWASIITEATGGLENISIAEEDCDFIPYEGPINNILIDLRITPIDGAGGILGQAGPCLFWDDNGLPAYGIMEFDSADAASLGAGFRLVVLHEMGHVLGFGSIWEDDGIDVLDEPCRSSPGATPGFNGPGAVAQFGVLGGDGNPPIENDYGPGTRCSHWDEGYFDNELMTGFLNDGTNPFSALTIASMGDLGYTVDLSQAEDYEIPACSPDCDDPGLRALALEEPWEIILEPRGTINANGDVMLFENDR
jgi:hypothetical protein